MLVFVVLRQRSSIFCPVLCCVWRGNREKEAAAEGLVARVCVCLFTFFVLCCVRRGNRERGACAEGLVACVLKFEFMCYAS